jgi:major membrane immunogen (membrane-anchored lipoprotein)
MKKLTVSVLICVLLLLPACGKAFRNGSYEGRSTDDSRGAYGIVSVKVEGGKIASADFVQYNADGTVKGEKYGEEAGEDNYKLAQKALEQSKKYPEQLIKTQDVEQVDAVSGATTSWKQFQEAARDALAKAK